MVQLRTKPCSFLKLFLLTCIPCGALSGQGLPAAAPDTVGISGDRLARLEGVIASGIEEEKIPGAVVIVVRRGRTVYRKAFGLRAATPSAEPMSVDSVFDVASLTKVVATATSLMVLVEEGRLSLNEKASEFIPGFGRKGKSDVTLLQLVTHFSGLRPDLDLDYQWEGYETAIDLACRERLVEEAGSKFIYSDINYLLLGEVVRRVSGLPLDQFAQQRVFQPLQMKDTGFKPGPGMLERVVPTEKRNGLLLRGEVHDPTAARMGGIAGHAGLFSTADDVARWAQMVLNGGILEGVRLLAPMGVLSMCSPSSPAGQLDWRALGFDVSTRFSTVRGDLFPVGSFGHTGFTGTSVWIDPFSESIVILFTSRLHPDGNGDVVALRSRLASVVAGSILDIPLSWDQYYRGR